MSSHRRPARNPPAAPALLPASILRPVLTLVLAAVVCLLQQPAAQAAAPVAPEESAVSAGSWFCSRYVEAAAADSPAAADVLAAVRAFSLGYVYGVSEAVGKPFPEAADNDRRIVELLDRGCREDGGRAVRDATLLAGRSMLEDARSAGGSPAADATGMLACQAYLDASGRGAGAGAPGRPAARLDQVRNWADGYINARFERAGRGLIPTAKNKALMLERFSAACTARPSTTVREAARGVVEATLPGK
ncbi:MAG: hypothetical protein ACK515_08325 [bacterium]|nr:hypothetical protein [Betaproteobacteria bacterium]